MRDPRLAEIFGVSVPIQLAAMPGVASPELVSAVAAAGGFGVLPATMLSADGLGRTLAELTDRKIGAFGVNFLMPFLDRACVDVAARGAPYVEFFYGEPDAELVARVHSLGARAGWQVGSLAEAVAAERAGCDLAVVQGTAAGGHVRGRISLFPLLSQVLDELRIPVLAAGGIATARDVAAVLASGAAGARVGTRFVAAAESRAHPDYVNALIGASAEDTCLTEAFSVLWPDAPHRVLRSSVAAAQAIADDIVGEGRSEGQAVPIPRLSVFCPSVDTTGRTDAMALYAGESVTQVRRVQPAAEIVAELTAGGG